MSAVSHWSAWRVHVVVSPLSNARFPVPVGADAVPGARRLVVAIVREWGVPLSEVALEELELCASEVIANALVHTGERCVVTVHWCGGRVRVEVADRGAEPRPKKCDGESTSGRGLLLVEALAHAWGWYPTTEGKVVWFEYPETPEAPCPTYGWGAAFDVHVLGRERDGGEEAPAPQGAGSRGALSRCHATAVTQLPIAPPPTASPAGHSRAKLCWPLK
ncbi:ATP-binding protein [Kitasatospora sp. NPDC056783]|uniref:ATP-binding protein n=1 Tax=Kitasatospora sp. NPDC056783 TaxID=3345943 RepID=UPI003676EC6A